MELTTGFAGIILLIGVTIWRSFARERLRTRKLTNLAPGLGFSMVKENRLFELATPLFSKGDVGRNRFRNAMQGTAAGLTVVLFDFYYQVDRGDENSSAWHTVAAFAFPNADFPSFSITKSGFLSRRAACKIEIEANPDFSQRFVVNGRDEAEVQKLLTPDFLHAVVSSPASEKLIIEAAGPWLVLYRRCRRFPPEQWESFLHEVAAIASTFALDYAGNQTRNACRLRTAV